MSIKLGHYLLENTTIVPQTHIESGEFCDSKGPQKREEEGRTNAQPSPGLHLPEGEEQEAVERVQVLKLDQPGFKSWF